MLCGCNVSSSLIIKQGRKITGNEEGAVDIKKQRTWRQYMNRCEISPHFTRTYANNCLQPRRIQQTSGQDKIITSSRRNAFAPFIACFVFCDSKDEYLINSLTFVDTLCCALS